MANKSSRRKALIDRADHKAGRPSTVINHGPSAFLPPDEAITRTKSIHPKSWKAKASRLANNSNDA